MTFSVKYLKFYRDHSKFQFPKCSEMDYYSELDKNLQYCYTVLAVRHFYLEVREELTL